MSVAVKPRHFNNRESAWLAFNHRVLEEAQKEQNPLLERALFLGIVANNLDEFCMVRLAAVHEVQGSDVCDPSGMNPKEQLESARQGVQDMMAAAERCWFEHIEPGLARQGLVIEPPNKWSINDKEILDLVYSQEYEAVLTPMAVDPARPFPLVDNLTIHIAVLLREQGHDHKSLKQAVVPVPYVNRLVQLEIVDGVQRFALLEDVIATHLSTLFRGYDILDTVAFRVTRDGSLDIDEEEATDLLREIEQELVHRVHGEPLRLEIRKPVTSELVGWLQQSLQLDALEVVYQKAPLDFRFCMGLRTHLQSKSLTFKPFTPAQVKCEDYFNLLGKQELLLHHPFDDFQPVVDLVTQAAKDDQVQAIKMTLYRVSGGSPIVRALRRAALNGKRVTVLLELKARFDEEANIRWARHLEEVGVNVIYGLVGYKVHSKLMLIIRREEEGIRRYCHIGTGNYNDKTAKLYTDFSYMTSDEAVGSDVSELFNVLTGYSIQRDYQRVLAAPLTMRDRFVALIRREAAHAQQGKKALIQAKFNSLVDVDICEELYQASAAGVKIELVIRGVCILRPGVVGLSENIRVRSVVGRFLEHSRLFIFYNKGAPQYFIGSADWMTRNLDRRVECIVEIISKPLKSHLQELFERYMADNASSRGQLADGSYQSLQPKKGEPRLVQQELIDRVRKSNRRPQTARLVKFTSARSPQDLA